MISISGPGSLQDFDARRRDAVRRRLQQPIAYVMSNREIEPYREAFCLDVDHIKAVSVPRHAQAWIHRITNRATPPRKAPYIFVLLWRSVRTVFFASPSFPPSRSTCWQSACR
jgi:hypothetical protein